MAEKYYEPRPILLVDANGIPIDPAAVGGGASDSDVASYINDSNSQTTAALKAIYELKPVVLTQAQYDALPSKNPDVLYLISG